MNVQPFGERWDSEKMDIVECQAKVGVVTW